MNWFTWAFLSALFAGLTAILAKAGVAEINSHLATAIRSVVIVIFTGALAAALAPAHAMAAISKRTWLFLIISGVTTGLSWLCYFRALQLGPASRVAPVDKLSVVFAIILAAIFLKEKLGWQETLGGALITLGALVLAWKPS
jgi:transporter family protein